jgi:capsular polysaccharide transport system ATP-binding protein
MRARLAFGLSMAVDFDVYLVDEVTAVGDSFFQKKCREAFEARQERSSVIMVSHNFKTIKEYCQRCAVLEAGKLTIYGSVEQAMRQYDPS